MATKVLIFRIRLFGGRKKQTDFGGKGITLENGEELDDTQLEKRLILLERSDVIGEGSTAFRFKGIGDDVFNQVFQLLYSEEKEYSQCLVDFGLSLVNKIYNFNKIYNSEREKVYEKVNFNYCNNHCDF